MDGDGNERWGWVMVAVKKVSAVLQLLAVTGVVLAGFAAFTLRVARTPVEEWLDLDKFDTMAVQVAQTLEETRRLETRIARSDGAMGEMQKGISDLQVTVSDLAAELRTIAPPRVVEYIQIGIASRVNLGYCNEGEWCLFTAVFRRTPAGADCIAASAPRGYVQDGHPERKIPVQMSFGKDHNSPAAVSIPKGDTIVISGQFRVDSTLPVEDGGSAFYISMLYTNCFTSQEYSPPFPFEYKKRLRDAP